MKHGRKLSHLLWKSKVIPLGVEHFLAMFPATILVPITINSLTNSNVIDTPLVLFTSGIGTIVFLLCSRLQIPTYTGSSFAFIGLSAYMVAMLSSSDLPGMTPELAFSYVGWAYLFSGIVLIGLSLLYKAKKAKNIFNFLLPASVIGPAVSLIGLELADSAVQDAGFVATPIAAGSSVALSTADTRIVALVTLLIIVLATIYKRKTLRNSAIVLGMVVGFALSLALSDPPVSLSIFKAAAISIPRFSLPLLRVPPASTMWPMMLAILPATLVVFTENISRVTVISRMTDNDNRGAIFSDTNIDKFRKATLSHGLATFIATLLGSVPNTLYAENIAVMGTHSSDLADDNKFKDEKDRFVKSCHNSFSTIPYFVAAVLAIIASFSGHFQQFLLNVPTPVLGGMKLFLFGIISAPGIQLLVEQKVNYNKISNQLLTASVLISGISGVSIRFGDVFELKGMSLGLVVGVFVNLFVEGLDWFGKLNDTIELNEVFVLCASEIKRDAVLRDVGGKQYNSSAGDIADLLSGEIDVLEINANVISADTILSTVSDSNGFTFELGGAPVLKSERTAFALYVKFAEHSLPDDARTVFLHDYSNSSDNAVEQTEGYISVRVGANVPLRKVKEIIKLIG
jgi:uracil permease